MTRHVLDAGRLQWLILLMVLANATPLSAHVLHGQLRPGSVIRLQVSITSWP